MLSNSTIVSIFLRVLQFSCAFVNFGLELAIGGMLIDTTTYGGWWIYFFIVFLLTIIYLIVILIPQCLKRVPPWVFFMTETIYMVLWLVYFAAIAVAMKNRGCSDYWEGDTWCTLGKPVLAFSVISWLTFCLSLVFLVVFTIIPCVRVQNIHGIIYPMSFNIGAIYLQRNPTKHTYEVEIGSNGSHKLAEPLKESPTP